MILIITVCCNVGNVIAQPMGRLMLHMTAESVHENVKNRVEADVYYLINEGKMITHYTYPKDYVRESNRLGEVKMYFPENNAVVIQQDEMYSSENDVLHYFLYNKLTDLGLTDLGYKLIDNKEDDGVMVTEWEPVVYESEDIKKIVLAHLDNLPIYTAYFKVRNKLVRKVYYSDFEMVSSSVLPTTMIDVTYFPKGDSIVNRKLFSDMKFGISLNESYFNFKVPDDAKRIEGLNLEGK